MRGPKATPSSQQQPEPYGAGVREQLTPVSPSEIVTQVPQSQGGWGHPKAGLAEAPQSPSFFVWFLRKRRWWKLVREEPSGHQVLLVLPSKWLPFRLPQARPGPRCPPPEFCLIVAQGHWPPELSDPPLREGVLARRKALIEQHGMRGGHLLGRGPWVTGRTAKD